MAILAGAVANWVMLTIAFSIWFSLTGTVTANPAVLASGWALLLMGIFAGFALTPVGESFFRFLQGCRSPIRQEEERLQPLFNDVCAAADIDPSKYALFVSDDKFPNAFAMGRKTICVTRSLLKGFTDDELHGVLAHELGHHVNGDTIRSIVFYMITLVGQVIMWGGWLVTKVLSIFTAIGRQSARPDDPAVLFQVFAKILWALMWLFQVFVWIPIFIGSCVGSRSHEFRSDLYAAQLGYKDGLLSFLNKILDFDGHPQGFLGLLYRTHPKTGDRIRRLEDLEEIPSLEEKHQISKNNSVFAIFEGPQGVTLGIVGISILMGLILLVYAPHTAPPTALENYIAQSTAPIDQSSGEPNFLTTSNESAQTLTLFLQNNSDKDLISNWADSKQNGRIGLRFKVQQAITCVLFDPDEPAKRERVFNVEVNSDGQSMTLVSEARHGFPNGFLKTPTQRLWMGERAQRLDLTFSHGLLLGEWNKIKVKFAADLDAIPFTAQEQRYHDLLSGAFYKALWFFDNRYHLSGGELCLMFEDMQGKSTNTVQGVMFEPRFPDLKRKFTAIFDPNQKSVSLALESPERAIQKTLSPSFNPPPAVFDKEWGEIDWQLTFKNGAWVTQGKGFDRSFGELAFYKVTSPDFKMPLEAVNQADRDARQFLKNGGTFKNGPTVPGYHPVEGPIYLEIEPFSEGSDMFTGYVYDNAYSDQKRPVAGFIKTSGNELNNIFIIMLNGFGINPEAAKTPIQEFWVANRVKHPATNLLMRLRVLQGALVGELDEYFMYAEGTPDRGLEFWRVEE